MTNQKGLYNFLDDLLKEEGFLRKKEDWYLETEECFSILGIGKSSWSGQYAIVLSISVKAINKGKFPPPHKANIGGFNLELTAPNKKIRDALNLEIPMPLEERKKIIRTVITKKAIPFLKTVSSVKGLKNAIRDIKALNNRIDVDLRNFLFTKK